MPSRSMAKGSLSGFFSAASGLTSAAPGVCPLAAGWMGSGFFSASGTAFSSSLSFASGDVMPFRSTTR